MPGHEPLPISVKIARKLYAEGIIAEPRGTSLARIVDSEVRPLVDALDLFCGDTTTHRVSEIVKKQFPANWKAGAAVLASARD